MKADDIINKYLPKPPRMEFIPGGSNYHGQPTEMFQKMCDELEANGFKIGTDCRPGGTGTAILYIYDQDSE